MAKKTVPPLTLLAAGIKSGNWQQVCEAYSGLTGLTLSVPMNVELGIPFVTLKKLDGLCVEVRSVVNDLIQTAADDMGRRVDQAESATEIEEVESTPVHKKAPSKKAPSVKKAAAKTATKPAKPVSTTKPSLTKPAPVRKRATAFLPEGHHNTFVDDGKLEPKLVQETREMVKKGVGSSKERRPGVNYVTVKCSRCSNEDRVPDSYASLNSGKDFGGYVCNSCTPQGGGR